MTREEKQTILTAACDRAYEQLSMTEDFANSETVHLLENISTLQWMLRDADGKSEEEREPVLTVTGVAEPQIPVPAVEEPVKSQFTREQVRAALNVARKDKGIKIPDLLAKYNVTTFTDLPESKYDALMAELEAM